MATSNSNSEEVAKSDQDPQKRAKISGSIVANPELEVVESQLKSSESQPEFVESQTETSKTKSEGLENGITT